MQMEQPDYILDDLPSGLEFPGATSQNINFRYATPTVIAETIGSQNVQISEIDWNSPLINDPVSGDLDEVYPSGVYYIPPTETRPFSILSNRTTKKDPKVIVDTEASFCDVLLFVDSTGEAIHFHHPLSEMPESQAKQLLFNLENSVSGLMQFPVLVLSGSLYSRELIQDVFQGYPMVTVDEILPVGKTGNIGIIFVPQILAKSGENTVLVPTIFNRTEIRNSLGLS
jgi:hypothetical protein